MTTITNPVLRGFNPDPSILRVGDDYEQLTFYYSKDGADWTAIGPVLDAGKISDENAETVVGGYLIDQGFTGAFIGLCVQDLSGSGKHADFDYLTYRELDRK